MRKLSELDMDTMLTVEDNRYCCDLRIMSKEDFLDSAYFLDYPVEPLPIVTLAKVTYPTFDLWDVIEWISEDETYEDWDSDVYRDLMSFAETKSFLELVKEVFEAHPVYWEGDPVEIDMYPEENVKNE